MRYWAIVGCRERLDFEEWKKLVENEGQVLEEQYNSYINDLEKFTAKSEYYRKELEAKQAEEDYLKKKHPVLWALKKGARVQPVWLSLQRVLSPHQSGSLLYWFIRWLMMNNRVLVAIG